MRIDFLPEGIHLPQIGLWLDPRIPVEAAWLSHAHSDHAQGLHDAAIATPRTMEIYCYRWPCPEGRARQQILLPVGESMEWRGATLTAAPAAHILGAAQLLIEFEGERVIYTGDIKRRTPICGWETVMLPCDRLIIESTFGLPIFSFLSEETARERMRSFALETIAEGRTPVFLGYGLGRGQEIVYSLTQAGVPCAVHGAIAALIPHYEKEGYQFPGWERYERRKEESRALVVTPGMQGSLAVADARIALVSGWAALDNARTRGEANVLIPYSDHGDFEELLQMVRESGARKIDVVHGYAEPFARILRDRGLDASSALPGVMTEAEV